MTLVFSKSPFGWEIHSVLGVHRAGQIVRHAFLGESGSDHGSSIIRLRVEGFSV